MFGILERCSPRMRRGGIALALALGLAIPTQIALITFDNYPFSMLTELAITAVDLDMHEMGINAVRFILQRVLKPNLLTQSYCTLPAILEQGAT